jgi:hypothetical protein
VKERIPCVGKIVGESFTFPKKYNIKEIRKRKVYRSLKSGKLWGRKLTS